MQRCGRLDDQIELLKHKLNLIHQGLAFNGKRTKTARSQGKKFQVSIEQEATRLLVSAQSSLLLLCSYLSTWLACAVVTFLCCRPICLGSESSLFHVCICGYLAAPVGSSSS